MFAQQTFGLDNQTVPISDARSIGNIINGLREVAALREKVRQDRNFLNFASPPHAARAPRLRALRGNSA